MATLYWQELDNLNSAIESDPRDESALGSRGLIWETSGALDKALADYSRVIELNPVNPEAYIHRGSAYLKRADYHNAIIDETVAIQLAADPCDPIAYFYRAQAYRELQRWTEARDDYETYIETAGQGDCVLEAQAYLADIAVLMKLERLSGNLLILRQAYLADTAVLIEPSQAAPAEGPTGGPHFAHSNTGLLIDASRPAEAQIAQLGSVLQPIDTVLSPSMAINALAQFVKSRIIVDSTLAISAALMISAGLLWFVSLRYIDLRQMNDLGLVSVLPASSFVALGFIILSFCLSMRAELTRRREIILYGTVITLIVMLYGVTSFVEQEPHIGVTWALAGFSESIMRTGKIFTWLDARYSWPGVFSASALLTQVAGLSNPIVYASWAALALNLMYLAPLQLIFQTLTDDRRIAWLAVWCFYLLNWIGQDYWSPQGFNFVLYLAIYALLLRWFRGHDPLLLNLLDHLKVSRRLAPLLKWLRVHLDSPVIPDETSGGFQRIGLIALLIVLFVADASSHQLTPIALILGVGALAIFDRFTLRTLPVLFAIIMAVWISYMTTDFLQGHLVPTLAEVGNLSSSVSQNVTQSVHGSSEHQIIIYFRLAMTLIIWVLAFLGGLRRLQKGRIDLTCLLLMLAPFPILGLNSYGGEAMLRIYLFALPFTAFLAAALIFPSLEIPTSNMTTVITGIVSVALLGGFLFTRYGNERMDYFSTDEVAGVNYLYNTAPAGSRFVTPLKTIPGYSRDVEKYTFAPDPNAFLRYNVPAILSDMSQEPKAPSYLIFTRSQEAYAELYYGADPGWEKTLQGYLLATNRFKVIFQNRDVIVMVLND